MRTRVPYLVVTLMDAVPAMLECTQANVQCHQLLYHPHVPVQLMSHFVKGDMKAYAVAPIWL